MRLLSSAQESVLENLLDQQDRLSSYLLCSLMHHLQLATTPSRMPGAKVLSNLWELLVKIQVGGVGYIKF